MRRSRPLEERLSETIQAAPRPVKRTGHPDGDAETGSIDVSGTKAGVPTKKRKVKPLQIYKNNNYYHSKSLKYSL